MFAVLVQTDELHCADLCPTLISAIVLDTNSLFVNLSSGLPPPVHLPEAERLMLSLCCHEDRPAVWKMIYFEALSSGKHFLEQVLVSGF